MDTTMTMTEIDHFGDFMDTTTLYDNDKVCIFIQ